MTNRSAPHRSYTSEYPRINQHYWLNGGYIKRLFTLLLYLRAARILVGGGRGVIAYWTICWHCPDGSLTVKTSNRPLDLREKVHEKSHHTALNIPNSAIARAKYSIGWRSANESAKELRHKRSRWQERTVVYRPKTRSRIASYLVGKSTTWRLQEIRLNASRRFKKFVYFHFIEKCIVKS